MASDQNKGEDAPTAPPKREPFFDTVRRISDYQISTLLHSLIGLPSSLSPPQNSGWIGDADLTAVDGRDELMASPKAVRSGSNSIADEVRKLRDDEERKGGSGSGGMGMEPTISKAATSTGAAGSGSGDSAKREMTMLPDSFSVPSPASMLRGFEELHNKLFRPLLVNRSSASASANSSNTELDYYIFFEQQFRRPPSGATGEGKTVVERASEVRSVASPDGVTRTGRIEVKRFSDGTEERKEGENTALPRDGGGGERVREITE